MHGLDVFQAISAILSHFELALLIDELEMCSILIAGLAHDVGHDG